MRTPRESIVHAAVAGVLAAQLTGLAVLPWSHASGLLPTSLFALPLTLVLCLVWAFIGPPLVARVGGLERLAFSLVMVWVGSMTWLAGSIAGNQMFVEAPLQGWVLKGYGIAAAAAVGVVAVVWWRLPRSRFFRVIKTWPSRTIALLSGVTGLTLATLDALAFREAFWRLHLILLVLIVGAFVGFSYSGLNTIRWHRRVVVLTFASASFGGIAMLERGSLEAVYADMLRSDTLQQRLLVIAREVTDGDGDGHSAFFGGGDCDDTDPSTFPLSQIGKDCMGWREAARPLERAPIVAPGPEVVAPHVIVLITIDAFRCAMHKGERPELAGICPSVQQLAGEGRIRFDAYTTHPNTRRAMASLHAADPRHGAHETSSLFLARWMAEQGRATHAIATHKQQFSRDLKQSYQTIDLSLQAASEAEELWAITSERLTDRVLGKVGAHLRFGAQRLFLWAHYLDAHAPYVHSPGSPWALSSTLSRYKAEIRRTDQAIGRLANALRAHPMAHQVFLLLTADHGEGLGEKGRRYHGFSAYEPAVRVPMVAWSPGSEWLNRISDLPATTAEIAPFLMSLAGGAHFTSRNEAFFVAEARGGSILGLQRGGWKLIHHQPFGLTELFHLSKDPREERDLAHQNPGKVAELGVRLGAYLRPWAE